jgi:hypothetical protein
VRYLAVIPGSARVVQSMYEDFLASATAKQQVTLTLPVVTQGSGDERL